jgi:hypothetical protein
LANYALNRASTDGYNPQLKRDAKGFKDALDEKVNNKFFFLLLISMNF